MAFSLASFGELQSSPIRRSFLLFCASNTQNAKQHRHLTKMGMAKHKRPSNNRLTMMASSLKAWSVQEKNGLKDFVLVGQHRCCKPFTQGMHRYSAAYHFHVSMMRYWCAHGESIAHLFLLLYLSSFILSIKGTMQSCISPRCSPFWQ